MVEKNSQLYKFTYLEKRVSDECFEIANQCLELIPKNSELVVVPSVMMEDGTIVLEYDTPYGEFSLWVCDHDSEFYVEWSFSAKNSEIYLDGFCTSMTQIIYMCQNSIFGGHK